MITTEQYFRKPRSDEHEQNADQLLARVNALLNEAQALDVGPYIDPDTGSQISGSQGGDGDGGYRTPGSRTGSARSSHRSAMAVDVYDPRDTLDSWLDQFEAPGDTGGNTKLEQHGLYREHPTKTPGWCHLSTRAPGSGRRTFYP